LKLGQLINAKESFEKLFNYGYLPNSIMSYYLAEPLKICQEEYDKFTKIKSKLIIKYGSKDKDGNVEVRQNTPAMLGLQKEINEVLNIDIDCDFSKIKLNPNEILTIDDKLPIEKKLGFSAKNWLAISELIQIEK
jgi:hypothetical protein